MSAADSGVACTTLSVQRFTLSFANGHIFSDGPLKVTVGNDQSLTADSETADFTGSVRSNFGWIVRPLDDI